MAIKGLAKQAYLNFTEYVLHRARKPWGQKEIKELDFSGDTRCTRQVTVTQSFKATIQVMSQN